MKDNNKILHVISPYIHSLNRSYDSVIYHYEKNHHSALGLSDCHIYALAIIEKCSNTSTDFLKYLKDKSPEMHADTYLFLLYSFVDLSITLKLDITSILASLSDAAYEVCRRKTLSNDIVFMNHYMTGWLLSHSVDDDKIKDEMSEEWFSICLLALDSFKKARKFAILNDVNLPTREALLDIQISTIQMSMINPHIKRGFPLGAINILAYNHSIKPGSLRNVEESCGNYLTGNYKRSEVSNIITTPYNFDPNEALSL